MHHPDQSAPLPPGEKIVLVTHEYAPFRGGVATYVEELATALQKRMPTMGIHVLTLGGSAENDKNSAIPIERLGGRINLRLPNRLRLIRALWQRRQNREIWVLCSYGALFAMMVLQWLVPGRFPPYLILLHGSELLKFNRNILLRALSKKACARAFGVAATSHHVCELLLCGYLGKYVQHGFVLPCGPPAWLAKALPRAENPPLEAPKTSRLRVLTLARIHPRKGQLDTAKALARLPDALKSRVTWILAGAGDKDYLQEILNVCQENGVTVELKGEISPEHMAGTYANCDLYVMSSRSLPDSLEGFGITYLEAEWFGKPCVGYRTGGVAEAVRHEETGLLVEEGDWEKLSLAIATLLEDPGLRRRMGSAASRHARHFDWNQTAVLLQGYLERMPHAG